MKPRQAGFGVIAAIVILVILAGLGAALARMGTGQMANSAQDMAGARVWQTARAGVEWGLYRALRAGACPFAQTLSFTADGGYAVAVTCATRAFNEGETGAPPVAQVKTIFTINALACNASACPDAAMATTAGYVERRLTVTACTIDGTQNPC